MVGVDRVGEAGGVGCEPAVVDGVVEAFGEVVEVGVKGFGGEAVGIEGGLCGGGDAEGGVGVGVGGLGVDEVADVVVGV